MYFISFVYILFVLVARSRPSRVASHRGARLLSVLFCTPDSVATWLFDAPEKLRYDTRSRTCKNLLWPKRVAECPPHELDEEVCPEQFRVMFLLSLFGSFFFEHDFDDTLSGVWRERGCGLLPV